MLHSNTPLDFPAAAAQGCVLTACDGVYRADEWGAGLLAGCVGPLALKQPASAGAVIEQHSRLALELPEPHCSQRGDDI